MRPAGFTTLARSAERIHRAGRRVTQLIFDPLCVLCEARPVGDWQLCNGCAARLRWHDRKRCQLCARPVPAENLRRICADCVATPPPWIRLFVLADYRAPTRQLIQLWKHSDCPWYATRFGELLHERFADELQQFDCIAPVPLHWVRRWRRRYNQAEDLARCLATKAHLPLVAPLRRSAGPPLSTLDRTHRARAARRTVHLRTNRRERAALAGRSVLVVDDVFTTGATTHRCARLLRAAGCRSVGVATVARTP